LRRRGRGTGGTDMRQEMAAAEARLRPSAELATPRLSVVMPVYNEADGLEEVVAELEEELFERIGAVEIVMVDDASTDATPRILDLLASSDRPLKVHHAARHG